MAAPTQPAVPTIPDPRTAPDQATYNTLMSVFLAFIPVMMTYLLDFVTWLGNEYATSLYLGAKTTAPTLNNQGGALVAGNTYLLTTNNTMYVFNGSWVVAGIAIDTGSFALAARVNPDNMRTARRARLSFLNQG